MKTWRGGKGREVPEGGDTCLPVAASCRYWAQTNTILESNDPPIKDKAI